MPPSNQFVMRQRAFQERRAAETAERNASYEKAMLDQLARELGSAEAAAQLLQSSAAAPGAAATAQTLTAPAGLSEACQMYLAKRRDAQLCTSDIYSLQKPLPERFNIPADWKYKVRAQHPCYSTTSNQYGSVKPTAWEMPTTFNGMTNTFTETLNQAGPYKNCSLNIK